MISYEITNDRVVIHIPYSLMQAIVDGADCAGAITPNWKITNAKEFAKYLFGAMDGSEAKGYCEGSTLLDEFLDKLVVEAISNGAKGIEHIPEEGSGA